MATKLETFIKSQLKTDLPDIRPGDTVRVYQRIKEHISATKSAKKEVAADEKEKERTQIFDGLVIARKHGKEAGATITVRKEISGIGVEKTFPLHSPTIEKIEIIKRGKVRRAKLYYIRKAKGERARLKIEELEKEESGKEAKGKRRK